MYKTNKDLPELHQRILDGEKRYGESWCEVNLKQDVIEELFDVYNYATLMRARLAEQTHNLLLTDEVSSLLDQLQAMAVNWIAVIEVGIPQFEGPTSAEWVKNQE